MIDVQTLTNNAVASLMANSQLYTDYRAKGRDVSRILTNILICYMCLKEIPYMETTDNHDINRAQGLIAQTI